MVRALQERAARGLPAEHVEVLDGWRLRHAPGCAWWVGTALPHGDAGPHEPVRRVARAEEFYASRGVVTRFQITPGVCPDGLDTLLAQHGYRRESLMSLQVASTEQVLELAGAGSLRVRLDDHPSRVWFEAWQAVHGHFGDSAAEWALLGRVAHPSCYAAAMLGTDVVAVGRAVADTGWAGIFGMATVPEARGRGAARSVLGALADWARANRAGRMYLQVERDNVPALGLYEKAGFSEVSGYHYRAAV
jgi:ribosomal protein S18 acetylase RimI-like enzyme